MMDSKAERDRVIHEIRTMLSEQPYGNEASRTLQSLYRRLCGRHNAPPEVV